jgi:DNA repair exonuclease SbcCD nuclease subunit
VVAGKFTLLPAPLTQRHTYVDLTEWFAAHVSTDDLPRIGLAHGSVQGILPEEVDSANPIAASRAQGAGLAYLALGDWHGTKRVDGKTWYAGTPESDRFKANESGQALLVTIEAAAHEPMVTAVATGKFGWRQIEQQMAVDSDVNEVVRTLDAVSANDVLHVRLSGTCNLAGHRKLSASLGAARAKARAVLWDAAALRLAPTEEDIQALHADGFVGEALHQLREQQAGPEPELARDAILALARILDDQGPGRGAGA